MLSGEGNLLWPLFVIATELEHVAAIEYTGGFIVHLAAGREDLEKDGLEGAAGADGLAFGPFGGASGGCACGAGELDGGGVYQEEGINLVAELRRQGEEGEGAAPGFSNSEWRGGEVQGSGWGWRGSW